jgi:3-methylcrotonyl-CoA carboxylase alpha subunit
MIAKLIVWDTNRAGAVRRLRAALAEYQVVGVTTNLAFLGAVAAHPAYAAAELDTRFLDRHRDDLVGGDGPASDTVLAVVCLDEIRRRAGDAERAAAASQDPYSPWNRTDGWRLNADYHHTLTFVDAGELVRVVAHYRPGEVLLDLPGGRVAARLGRGGPGELVADLGGARIRATVVRNGADRVVMIQGRGHRLAVYDPDATAERDVGGGSLVAPMPGKVVAVMVQPGAEVKKGAPLLVLEAMKMEHTVVSPRDGRVAEVRFETGALVGEGAQLVVLEPVPEEG